MAKSKGNKDKKVERQIVEGRKKNKYKLEY